MDELPFDFQEGAALPKKKRKKRAPSVKKDFESSLTRLEVLVTEIEKGQLPLEQSMEYFEEGIKLAQYCSEKLSFAEKKVEILLKKNGKEEWLPWDKESSRS